MTYSRQFIVLIESKVLCFIQPFFIELVSIFIHYLIIILFHLVDTLFLQSVLWIKGFEGTKRWLWYCLD